MYRILNVLALLLLILAPWRLLMAEPSPIAERKLALIKELIEVTGAANSSEQYANAFSQQLISILKVSNPNLSERAIAIVEEEVGKSVAAAFANQTLQQKIYPIYARYFTEEELQGLIAFNRSPAGQKANQVMPLLIQESTQAAQLWARNLSPEISQKVLRRFSEEGIEVQLSPQSRP